MTSILMWAGIVLIILGWLALAWQASKRMAVKDDLEKFPQRKHAIQQKRNYCFLTIIAGAVLLLIAILS